MEGHDHEAWRTDLERIFSSLSEKLETEAQLKHQLHDQVKQIDLAVRRTLAVLQQSHSKISEVHELCKRARQLIEETRPYYNNIRQLIPTGLLHKYHDHWKFSLSQLVFASALIVWFEDGRLLSPSEASQMILGESSDPTLSIELEDFLTGVSYLPSELARLCVNSAIAKDYEKPKQIAAFVSELFAGFRLLNLKNDNLRKRYDSIKYDLKKIEEVVYDISIRGLSSDPSGAIPPSSSDKASGV